MSGDYDNSFFNEDISGLEDNPDDEQFNEAIIAQYAEVFLEPDVSVYRLRLPYSNETFLAAYKGEPLKAGDKVVVPTRYGRDLAQVMGPSGRRCSEIARIERLASSEDLAKEQYNKNAEKEAFHICKQKIEAHGLEMKLVSVHYLFDDLKIIFFFTSEIRVDFRNLVKELVLIFRSRIELRQIGVRDEARVVGGLGVCGRGFCCNTVSDKLKPVSIKMAKDQNLSLNSMKISGPCGRLLCCLAYEHSFYTEQQKQIPHEGSRLTYDGVVWKVTAVNVATGKLTMSNDDGHVVKLPFCRFVKTDGRWCVCREQEQ